jgi:hypothetical protein
MLGKEFIIGLQDALPAMASSTCTDVFSDPASRFFFCQKQREKQKVKPP